VKRTEDEVGGTNEDGEASELAECPSERPLGEDGLVVAGADEVATHETGVASALACDAEPNCGVWEGHHEIAEPFGGVAWGLDLLDGGGDAERSQQEEESVESSLIADPEHVVDVV
jgi:hypothetical protein